MHNPRATMKRTLAQTAGVDQQGKPHAALGSIYANDTARRRKQLFRSQENPEPQPLWQLTPQPAMSPLTDWILNKEEAFQKYVIPQCKYISPH
jgi:hypothetical protein